MKNNFSVLLALVFFGLVFTSQISYPPQDRSFVIIDMQLASPFDDPEHYLEDYIRVREALQTQRVNVVGAPNTPNIRFSAYRTVEGISPNTCRSIWVVRTTIVGDAAEGVARVIPCDQAQQLGIPLSGPMRFSPMWWPDLSSPRE
ncbi:MAG: hypothetical protein Q8K75_00450 [Chlamydiales bacterium]|nr:hypothetical protein [Chlamydiales bacterium]